MGDSSHKVRLQFSRIEFDTALLVTSEKRRVHGPQLVIFGTPNVFETNNGPLYTVDLPCGARHAVLEKPPVIELTLKNWFPTENACLPQLSGLAFELTARHCKSDKQQEVCHTYGYGVLPLAQLITAVKSFSRALGDTIEYVAEAPLTFNLIDRPMQFEVQFAQEAIKAGANSEEYTKIIGLQRAFAKVSKGAECFDRIRITLHGARLELPTGILPCFAAIPRALGGKHAGEDALPIRHFEEFAFLGTSAAANKAAARLKHVFEQQRDRTYAPYGGEGLFKGYTAMDPMWKSFFVPAYKRGCGVDEPSALALMCTWFDRRVPERLYSHLLRAQLSVHGMSTTYFERCLRGILATHHAWVMQAQAKYRPGPANFARKSLWSNDNTATELRTLKVDEQRSLNFIVSALTSMANACCYTTDFAEIARINSTSGGAPSVQGVEEIVTEQFETAPLRVRAIDCEDGAAWFTRLWLCLVTHRNSWNDPLVTLAAHVMDLFVVSINKMHCGECHIMPTLYLRECAYAMMMVGIKASGMAANFSDSSRQMWMKGIYDTCFWPSYMYHDDREGAVGFRTDIEGQLQQGLIVQWPIPHVLYAEPTRASPSNQMPTDTFHNSDDDEVRRRHAKHSMRIDTMDMLGSKDIENFGGLEPYITYPSMIDTATALKKPLELSRFYRGFVMGCFIPPVYRLVQLDLQQCLGHMDDRPVLTRTVEALAHAHYFADVSYFDHSKPKTFGVYHVQIAGNDPHASMIPYAPLSLELLLWVAHVHGVEPPVLPGRLPEHLERVPLEQLGQFERVPHVEEYGPLRDLLRDGERYRQLLYDAQNACEGANASSVPCLSDNDRALQRCIDVRFLPHNNAMDGAFIHQTVQNAIGKVCRAVFVARIPLAVAPQPNHYSTMNDDDYSALKEMMREMQLEHLDATQMVPLIDNKQSLLDLAHQYGIFERYSTKQWNALRHYMGACVRHAPLYLNFVCMACEVAK